MKRITAADLFCGAGGTSTGLLRACQAMGLECDLIAVNHWPVAIDTHSANHPYAKHLCESLENIDPRKLVPSGRLNLLVASPECTHHANARGGKPMSDQSRATAWCILRWAEALYIENIIIENVPEFRTWGPLGASGRPLKKLRGQLYVQFLSSLKALGYAVEDNILNAADYGDPTTRKRLFIIARRGGRRVVWPVATHAPAAKLKKLGLMFGNLQPWRPAREVIDWSLQGKSIFHRKKPLARKTLERIYAGLTKFGGPGAGPFLLVLRRHMDAQSLNDPVPALTAGGNHVGLVEPFLVNMKGKSKASGIEQPAPTQTTREHLYLAEPEAFILPHRMFDQGHPDSIDAPLRTIVGKNGRHIRVCEPVLVPFFGEREGQEPRAHSVDAPLPAVTGQGAGAVVDAVLVDVNHGDDPGEKNGHARRAQSIEQPVNGITAARRGKGLAECIVKYYGTAKAQSTRQPLATVTAKDRFALVETEQGTFGLDIRLRMLEPHELAAAMSFPKGYKFSGRRKEEIVKQIGNAVPVMTAQALATAVLNG